MGSLAPINNATPIPCPTTPTPPRLGRPCPLQRLSLQVGASVAEVKQALRAASLRWHPDKFLQQFGGRLQSAAAHEEVMAEVNAVSAALNGMVDWVRVHGQ